MSTLKGKRILLVDDDKKSSPYLIEDLKDTYLAEVTWLTKADFVLEALTESNFDAVLLDIMMPIPDAWNADDTSKADKGLSTGIILFKMIRSKFAKLPIIIFTAKTDVNFDDQFTKTHRKPEFVSALVKTIIKLLKHEN